jgi:hypothetical protein
MSYTTLYGINADGDVTTVEHFGNAWGAAPFIWGHLTWAYLPNVVNPQTDKFVPGQRAWYSDTRLLDDLRAAKMSRRDRLVYATTMDRAVVRVDNIHELADMFEEFERTYNVAGKHVCSLSRQAVKLRSMAVDGTWRGCCWQQTSVSDCVWEVRDGGDDVRSYNIDIDTLHVFVDFAEAVG